MIDISDELFDHLATNVIKDTATCGSDFENISDSLPYVAIVVKSNTCNISSQDSGSLENACDVMIQIDVFTNDEQGKKAKAKEIFNPIDAEMLTLGFTRTMCEPIPNLHDSTIFRLTSRYNATVSKNKTIYRR